MQYQLKISGLHYDGLKRHLFPGDDLEAVAVAMCGRHQTENCEILLVNKVVLIPYDKCERKRDYVRWKTEQIVWLIDEATKNDMAIVKFHSHPGGYNRFSELDDESDIRLISSIYGWTDSDNVHGSCVMLPNGKIFGRVFEHDMKVSTLERVSVIGDRIKMFDYSFNASTDIGFDQRTRQAFGDLTMNILKGMKVGIIGCSGTGSPTIEQLARLGVGKMVLVDPDIIEVRNLNRIINSKLSDAIEKRTKVSILQEAIANMGLGTEVTIFESNLYQSKNCLNALAECDVIFGCVDSVEGRHLLNVLSTFYLIPYFDLGVKLQADGDNNIDVMVGSVHYIQPGYSSLRTRRVYSEERLREEGLKRQNPSEYERLLEQKYIKGVDVDRPAVIGINMLISSFAINEFLNRLHPFKDEAPGYYARVMVDYCGGAIENSTEDSFGIDFGLQAWVGRGLLKPFLRMLELDLL